MYFMGCLNWAETGQGRDQAECGTGLDQAGAMPHLDRAAPGSGCHWARIQPGRDWLEANRARPELGSDHVGGSSLGGVDLSFHQN